MSRTYSNFLLFEDALDGIDGSTLMVQAVKNLLNPMVNIVEADCDTLLGEIMDTTFELEGRIEVATKEVLSRARIAQILGGGTYKIGVRNMSTCLSHTKGGVCQLCYKGSTFKTTMPDIGTVVSVPSMIVYQTDQLFGDGVLTTFQLSESTDDWYEMKIYSLGARVYPSHYTVIGTQITFTAPIPAGQVYTVHFFKQNTEPFQGYISKTYSGALLGMQPLPTLKPLLRMSLYENQFSDSFVGLILEEVSTLKAIPSTYIGYLEGVHGKMEKVLLALYLYSVYSQVEV